MWDPDEMVTLLYIDNSNIFISAQKYSAMKKNFLPGVQDTRCRIDMRKMIAMALNTRGSLDKEAGCSYSYVSEPPPFPQEMQKAIKESGVGIRIFERNAMSKEKEVDTTLTADAVEKIVLEREKKDKLIILFTGDRDMKPVVEKAEKYEWKINLWSFNQHLAREYERLKCLQIFRMKSYFDQLTFIETKWKRKIPEERSLTLTNRPRVDFDRFSGTSFAEVCGDTLADEIVEKCTELLRVPCQGRFIDPVHFALVICLQENYTSGDQIKNFYNFNDLIGSPPSPPDGGNSRRQQPEMFSTMKGACSKILAGKNSTYSCTLVETFTAFKQRLKYGQQVNGSIQLRNKFSILNPAPDDHDGKKKTKKKNGGNFLNNEENDGWSSSSASMDEEEENGEKNLKKLYSRLYLILNYWWWFLVKFFKNYFHLHLPSTDKIVNNFLMTTTNHHHQIQLTDPIEINDEQDSSSSTDEEEDQNGGKNLEGKINIKKQNNPPIQNNQSDSPFFEVVRGKQPKKSYRKYSKFCEYKFMCEKYPKCKCSHSPQEEEFFTVHRDVKPEMRRLYKTVECNRYKRTDGGGKCKYSNKSYLCPFAHGTREARCVCCHGDGLHFSGQCSSNSKRN